MNFKVNLKWLVLFYCIISAVTKSQWQPDFRLTNNPSSSDKVYNMGTAIAAENNYYYVTWYDGRDGNNEVYFKRSTDGASTWLNDQRLTVDPALSVFPNIVCFLSNVFICWQDHRTGTGKIFFKRSTDYGASWGADQQISFGGSSAAEFPVMAFYTNVIHAAYQDNRDGNSEIYYTRSTNGGLTWAAETRITNNSASSTLPSITAFGSAVKIVWADNRDGNKEIYIKQSNDSGYSWGSEQRLTSDTSESNYPSVSMNGFSLSVTWQDNRVNGWEIFYKRSTNNGVSWDADNRLTIDPFNSFNPSVTVSGRYVHVTWQDIRDGNWEIYYKQSPDNGVTWTPDLRLTVSNANSFYPSIITNLNSVNLCWMDDREGNYEIYFKRNPTGNPVSANGTSIEVPKEFLIFQNYPNPFNPQTEIQLAIPEKMNIKLSVYDITGKMMDVIYNGDISAGYHKLNWNASQHSGGIYFCRIESVKFNKSIKMILLK